ncbi:MAG TPA: hypothetical protein VE621_20455 [Bryobacteraceae bacterium]|nr:hypothetical protein [Bryobacteraceae bacterium]
MARRNSQSQVRWTDVKTKLASFDRKGLLGLIQDLYAANKDNQTFLHTRFGLGEDVLKPYKETLDRWLWPDVLRNQDTSVRKAKQAISSYQKAVGETSGVAELMVYYCEMSVGFCNHVGYDDPSYLDALVRMFEQALGVIRQLPVGEQKALIARLDEVSERHRLWRQRLYGLAACGICRRLIVHDCVTRSYRNLTEVFPIRGPELGAFGCVQADNIVAFTPNLRVTT